VAQVRAIRRRALLEANQLARLRVILPAALHPPQF
jgi:hypothetical protein